MTPTQSVATDGHGNVVVAVNDSQHVDVSIGRRRTIDVENTLVARDVKTIIDARIGRCFGRDEVLDELDAWVRRVDRGVRVVAAPAGFGKSTVLANWIDRLRERSEAGPDSPRERVVRHFFARLYRTTINETAALQHVHDQLAAVHGETDVESHSGTEGLCDRIFAYLKRDAPEDGGLILVIDGVDETEPNFPVFLRNELGHGVRIVFGVRANEDAMPGSVRSWLKEFSSAYDERVILAPLALSAVADWLRSEIRELATIDARVLANDLHRISDGIPLFLHHLIDDLTASPPTELRTRVAVDGAAALPRSFSEYLRRELEAMSGARERESIDDLLAVLTQIHAPIAVRELAAFRDDDNGLPLARCPFDRLDQRVARWLVRVGATNDPQLAFAHPRLAIEFRHCLLRYRVEAAQRMLLKHADRWNQAGMEYALVHGLAHLIEHTQQADLDADVIARAIRRFTDVEFHTRVVERHDGNQLLRRNAALSDLLDPFAAPAVLLPVWRASLREAAGALSGVPGSLRARCLHQLLWEFSADLGVAEPERRGIRLVGPRRSRPPSLRTIFEGNRSSINGALFFPDGDILTWGNDGSVRRWRADGSAMTTFDGHTSWLTHAHILPDGGVLSSSDDGTLRRWSSDGAPIATFAGHAAAVRGSLALPDGDFLSWSADYTLRRWSPDGAPGAVFEGHTSAVSGARVLANGDILSWSSDGTLRRWSHNGTPHAVFRGHASPVNGALVLHGGDILSWSSDGTLRRWSCDGAPGDIFVGHDDVVRHALVLPDGDVLSCSFDSTMRRWSPRGATRTVFKGHASAVWSATALPDGDIVSYGDDFTIRRWKPDGTLHELWASLQKAGALDIALLPVPRAVLGLGERPYVLALDGARGR